MSRKTVTCAWCDTATHYVVQITCDQTGDPEDVCPGCAMDAVVRYKTTSVTPEATFSGTFQLAAPDEPLPRRDPATGNTIYIS